MTDFKSRIGVITGAGSGIGRSLALLLAAQGCRLALADVNEPGLQETLALLPTGSALIARVDVSKREEVRAFAARVESEMGGADILINNAGVCVSQRIVDLRIEDFEWLMDINFWGVVHCTQAFLPMLIARKGTVVNVSSVFGLLAWPTQVAYSCSKFAVRAFTDALRLEVEGDGVQVICVHPGGVNTNLSRNQRFYVDAFGNTSHDTVIDNFKRIARTSPDAAAQKIVKGIQGGKRRIRIGAEAYGLDWLQRLFPIGHQALVRKIISKRAVK